MHNCVNSVKSTSNFDADLFLTEHEKQPWNNLKQF